MSAQPGAGAASNYFSQLFGADSAVSHAAGAAAVQSRRAEAARRLPRQALLLIAFVGAAIVALMYAVDTREIGLMPPRGTASLWPVRILTDFGKAAYVLWILAAMLFAVAVVSPRLRGTLRDPGC